MLQRPRPSSLLVVVGLFLLAGLLPAACTAESGVLSQGLALVKAGKGEEALALYRDALKKKPEPALYRALFSAMGKLGRFREALEQMTEALGRFPKDTSLLNIAGQLHLRLGERDQARKRWQEVLALDPKNDFASKALARLAAPASATAAAAPITGDDLAAASDEGGGAPHEPVVQKGFNASSSLPLAEQEKIAKTLYAQMAQTDKYELDTFIRLHRQVIETCPDTDFAQQSCWRL